MTLHPSIIGYVRSDLVSVAAAPLQGPEGAPAAWLDMLPAYADAMEGLEAGDEIIVLTWLHLAERSTLRTRPRGDPALAPRGVFATRSPDRPNPIGLHRVRVLAVRDRSLHVSDMEALHGTPIIDIKIALAHY